MEIKESLTYEEALDRYLKGDCPLCGRRMEKRKKLDDYFCHKCKRAWTGDNVLALRKELPTPSIMTKMASPKGSSSFFQRVRRLLLG